MKTETEIQEKILGFIEKIEIAEKNGETIKAIGLYHEAAILHWVLKS